MIRFDRTNVWNLRKWTVHFGREINGTTKLCLPDVGLLLQQKKIVHEGTKCAGQQDGNNNNKYKLIHEQIYEKKEHKLNNNN